MSSCGGESVSVTITMVNECGDGASHSVSHGCRLVPVGKGLSWCLLQAVRSADFAGHQVLGLMAREAVDVLGEREEYSVEDWRLLADSFAIGVEKINKLIADEDLADTGS